MTPIEADLVRQTFAQAEAKAGIAALTFYQRLFELDPSLRPLFHADIEEQGRKLMLALRYTVDTLESPQALQPVLESMGRRHVGYGVRDEHYDTVGAALLGMLEQVLGPAFTPETAEAWGKAYGHVAAVMKHAAAAMPAAAGVARHV